MAEVGATAAAAAAPLVHEAPIDAEEAEGPSQNKRPRLEQSTGDAKDQEQTPQQSSKPDEPRRMQTASEADVGILAYVDETLVPIQGGVIKQR